MVAEEVPDPLDPEGGRRFHQEQELVLDGEGGEDAVRVLEDCTRRRCRAETRVLVSPVSQAR